MWLRIKEALEENQHFILTTHVHPDGDGIGAATALIELLRALGKSCRFICDSPIPEKYRFLDYHGLHEEYVEGQTALSTEVLIVLDTNRRDRIGRLDALLDQPSITSICIDHHIEEPSFTSLSHIDSTACATGALIYSLFDMMKVPINQQAATGVYLSVLCDTGRFSYSCADRVAHRIADACIKVGADPDDIYSRIYQHVPLAEIKIFAAALQRMEIHHNNKIVVQEIRQEDYRALGGDQYDLENIDLEYILEFNKSIDEVECVVLLRELPNNQVRVSLRAKADLDISTVVKSLGGGGHCKAGGANVIGSVDEVKSMIVSMLENLITSENCIAISRRVQ